MCVASPKLSIPGDNFDVVQNLKRKKKKRKIMEQYLLFERNPTLPKAMPNHSLAYR